MIEEAGRVIVTWIDMLLSDGFLEISANANSGLEVCNKSATGARIFFHKERQHIAKVAHDPAYDVFVKWALEHVDLRVPLFHEHKLSGDPGEANYVTFTRMERLYELTAVEGQTYCAWYERIINRARNGEELIDMADDDPFGLLSTFVGLHRLAVQSAAQPGTFVRGFDLGKPTNLMARIIDGKRTLVYSDPLN